MKYIVIVGGGFCGIMTAVNLARFSHVPLEVTVINHGYPLACGIAHGARRQELLLNVAARNMSALPDFPNHFVDWLRTRVDYVDLPDVELREMYIPRRVYGEYLRSLALYYTRPVDQRSGVKVKFIEGEAIRIDTPKSGMRVVLASGVELPADKVVVATGNEAPAVIPGAEKLAEHSGYCPNPWINWEAKLPPESENVILLGTGLTMVDAMVTLLALNWRGTVHAVSRHGLLPISHFKGIEYADFPPAETDLASLGLARLAKLIEAHCERLRERGANSAIIVDKMRPHTQRVWQQFSLEEKKEFNSRYAARWNVIRHRIAPSVYAQVAQAELGERLKVTRASITSVEANGERVDVKLSDSEGKAATLTGSLVINCTGPNTRFSATRSKVLQSLLASGMAQPDAMDMGILVDADYALIDHLGKRSNDVFAIGPLLRGTLWESIAVPELRGQAAKVARTLIDECAQGEAAVARWVFPPEEAVMEYSI